MAKTFVLKTWPEPFQAVKCGRKRFEIRKNDRGFAVNDTLVLREFDPATDAYTGSDLMASVIHIERGPDWGLPEGLCVMGIEPKFETREE